MTYTDVLWSQYIILFCRPSEPPETGNISSNLPVSRIPFLRVQVDAGTTLSMGI